MSRPLTQTNMNDLEKFTNGELFDELERRGFIRVFWNKEDVMLKAEHMGITLSEEQVEDVMQNIRDDFDANIGVNWDVIRYHIENLV